MRQIGCLVPLIYTVLNFVVFNLFYEVQPTCTTTCVMPPAVVAENLPPAPLEEEPQIDPPPPQQILVQQKAAPERKYIQMPYPGPGGYGEEDRNPFSQKNMMQLMRGYPGALIRQAPRPNTKFAAFEEAQRAYYEKWCTSKTWEDDPPSAAAAVDWANTVLVLID